VNTLMKFSNIIGEYIDEVVKYDRLIH
jgi:hypothetical protein